MTSELSDTQAVIEREEPLRLSPRDWSCLLDLLENPPEPNARLKGALERYRQSRQDDAGRCLHWEP